jgi:mono/diheme cytochrome c family protein
VHWLGLRLAALLAWGGVQAAPVDYVRDLKPLLARHCVACHGATQAKAELRADTGAALLRGGTSGPAVIPGQPQRSLLLAVVEGTHAELARMPYKRPPLDSEAIQLLRQWITQGAPVPAQEEPSSDRHWAFVAPIRPAVPALAMPPLDAFIRHRLQQQGLPVAPLAPAAVRLRRLTLDLTGLPPTPAETEAFLNDGQAGAWERQVDRLLHSPRYGERWARWWLDAARYADSNGYSVDGIRTVWPYRDWVVRAFNADLPFDTFTRWQIAGDLLADEAAGSDPVLASGFQRHTQINHEGGIDPEQFRIESVMDRVSTTSAVWLGVTLGCAQCHDHKFDPFTQRDYYAFYAYFNSTENDGHAATDYSGTGPTLAVPTPAEAGRLATWEAGIRRVEAELAAAEGAGKVQLTQELAALRKQRPAVTQSLVLREAAAPRPTVVFVKGDFTRPGAPVIAATPAALPDPRKAAGRPDRRQLADWIVSPANPLTARVLVNRVWQVYFGRGLVETENDFGTLGSPPSHPELLDWLAVEFREHGWSLRHLHRLIVTSATYQASSDSPGEALGQDPRNLWLGRQNRLRLEAEQIRDNALAISGLLDGRVGGPPVFPPQPEGLGAFTQNRREWRTSTGGDRYRRALYTHLQRSTLHPGLAVFDAPDTFTTCTRRLRSNTPLQALTLLNDPGFHEFAEALARRLAAHPGTDSQRLHFGCQLAWGRPGQPAEVERLVQLMAAERAAGGQDPEAWLAVARVLLNLDLTVTRE